MQKEKPLNENKPFFILSEDILATGGVKRSSFHEDIKKVGALKVVALYHSDSKVRSDVSGIRGKVLYTVKGSSRDYKIGADELAKCWKELFQAKTSKLQIGSDLQEQFVSDTLFLSKFNSAIKRQGVKVVDDMKAIPEVK